MSGEDGPIADDAVFPALLIRKPPEFAGPPLTPYPSRSEIGRARRRPLRLGLALPTGGMPADLHLFETEGFAPFAGRVDLFPRTSE
jgi:hypothetical protein